MVDDGALLRDYARGGSEEAFAELVRTHLDIYTHGRVRENTIQFQQDENGAWRQVIPQQLMPKLERILSDPPDARLAGGK